MEDKHAQPLPASWRALGNTAATSKNAAATRERGFQTLKMPRRSYCGGEYETSAQSPSPLCVIIGGRRVPRNDGCVPPYSFPISSRKLPRSLPPRLIDAFPHRMMSAHELDAMAAIACADVDGLSMRGQRLWSGLLIGGTNRGRCGRDGLRRRRQRG